MSPPETAPALKEWAVIYDAILNGSQIVDLRKGGIHETGKHFVLRAQRFWLYPSYEHQRAELIKPAYRPALERSLRAVPPQGVIRVPGWAEIVAAAELTDADAIAALDNELIWTRDYAESRFRWKPRHPLHLLVLRAYRLPQPIDIPFRDAYRGCSSWVDLLDLPADPRSVPSDPVLPNGDFNARLDNLLARLPDPALIHATLAS